MRISAIEVYNVCIFLLHRFDDHFASKYLFKIFKNEKRNIKQEENFENYESILYFYLLTDKLKLR